MVERIRVLTAQIKVQQTELTISNHTRRTNVVFITFENQQTVATILMT